MSKTKSLSLKKNFSWNFYGSFVYSLSQFLLLIVLTKYISVENVGLYSLGLAITAPIILFSNLQLRQIQATDTTSKYSFNDYFGVRIIMGFVALFLIILSIVIGNYNFYTISVILFIGLSKIIDSYGEVTYGYFQQKERMDYIGKSRSLKGILSLLSMFIILLITNNFILSLIVLNISWFSVFILYDRKNIYFYLDNIRPRFSFGTIKNIIILALPLGIVVMINSLIVNLPRIVVETFHGAVILGYFTPIAYLLVVGDTFIQSIAQATSPRMAKLYKENNKKGFIKLLIKSIFIGFIIGVIGLITSLFFGEYLLKLIYDKTYANYNHILNIIMVSGIIKYMGTFLGYGITSMRVFKIQPIMSIFSLLLIGLASIILIPQYGIDGAAYTLLIGSTAQFIVRFIVLVVYFNK